MGDGNNPGHIVPNHVNDIEVVFMGGTKLAVIGIAHEGKALGVISNFIERILNLVNEFGDNLGGVRALVQKISPANKLDIGCFNQNGIVFTHCWIEPTYLTGLFDASSHGSPKTKNKAAACLSLFSTRRPWRAGAGGVASRVAGL